MKPILKAFKPLTPCSKPSILSNANWSGCCHSLIFVARVFKFFNTAFFGYCLGHCLIGVFLSCKKQLKQLDQ
ncbi:hypothetical protein EC532_02570 [Helicobacter pylori]|nr:hypothetical protein EC532_02570 [Helicobacter pylori]